jgi:membrane-associated phospholipid phosphatase
MKRELALLSIAAAATAGLALLARASARRETARVDEKVRKKTAPPEDHRARDFASALAVVGKWYTYLPMAAAGSAWLLLSRNEEDERPVVAALAVLSAGAVATALNPLLDDWLPQPPSPPGHSSPTKPVFPSGHAFGPGTVALTTAYVAAREGVAHPAIVFPIALIIPALTASTRVIEEKHWASDIAGGYLGAIALTAVGAAGYEIAVRRRRRDRTWGEEKHFTHDIG